MSLGENPHFNFSSEQLNNAIRVASVVCIGMLTLFLLVLTISATKAYPSIGEDTLSNAQNTISVSGQAEMDVHPDITTFSFSTDADGKTVEEAQNKAATLNNKAIEFLKGKGIAAADIKTTSYNTQTKYSNSYRPCPAVAPASGSKYIAYPCGSESVADGFTTYQSTEVKVRNIDKEPSKTGELIAGLGTIGVKASSPYSTVENPDAAKNAVRQIAIIKARQQAEVLARDLGVKLVRIMSFNETGGGNYPRPMYATEAMAKSVDAAIAPEISAGTNKISAEVTITYQIR